MSIVIVVKVSEGLVLGADSAATLSGQLKDSSGAIFNGVLKTFYNAKKLLQVGDFPIGVLNWGAAFIGDRTMESQVREWEHDNHWSSRDSFSNSCNDPFEVKACALGLHNHLSQVYAEEYADFPEGQRPPIGIIVAGYSEGMFFPEIWRFVLPHDTEVQNQRPDKNGKPDFGASWFGVTEPIVRLHFGRDDEAIRILSKRFKVPEQEILEALKPLQYPIAFSQMPLQDAIDYAVYMLNVAIGRFRFVLGPELCGGQLDIAVVTQNEFNWISQKSWRA